MIPSRLQLVGIHKRPRSSYLPTDTINELRTKHELPYLCVELVWDPPEGLHTSKQVSYQVFVRLIGPSNIVEEIKNTIQTELYNTNDDSPNKQILFKNDLLQRRLLANVTGNTFRSSESDNLGISYFI